MKGKDVWLLFLAALAMLFYFLFRNEEKLNKKTEEMNYLLRKENEEIKKAYFDLFECFIRQNPDIEPSILMELNRIKSEFDEVDTPTHRELESVIRHVISKEYSKAVRDLTKILEVKLKEKVLKVKKFKKNPSLFDLIKYAHTAKWITEQDYHNALKLKDVRNKESHELGVAVTPLDAGLMVFAGIKVLYAIARYKPIAVNA